MAYAMGGTGSPVRHIVLVHLIAIALLASFRAGMKLALWHSALLYATFYGQEVGLLGTFGRAAPEFGNDEFRLLVVWIVAFWMVAIATAAFAAVNERELRRQRYDLEALARLAHRLEEVTEAEPVSEALVDAVADDFGFTRVLLFASPGVGLGSWRSAARGRRPPTTRPASGRCSRRRWSAVRCCSSKPGPAGRQVALQPAPRHPEPRRAAAAGGRPGGRALIAEHSLRAGSRMERRVVSMLERFASQSALALGNAWLIEQIQRSAATDGLTGLANRASFEDSLEREIGRAAERATP